MWLTPMDYINIIDVYLDLVETTMSFLLEIGLKCRSLWCLSQYQELRTLQHLIYEYSMQIIFKFIHNR